MRHRHRNLDVVHQGMVLVSDGKGRGRPARLELTKDYLNIQVNANATDGDDFTLPSSTPLEDDNGMRVVRLKKEKGGGLGLSIKGGADGNQNVPIVISKIFEGKPADHSNQLFVGDAIVEVNGTSMDGKTHDEAVAMLRDAGDTVTLSVRHYTHIAAYLRPAISLQQDRSISALNQLSEPLTFKSAMKAQSEATIVSGESTDRKKLSTISLAERDTAPEGWKTLAQIPLPMAFITRYLWGTDKLRVNAFEVRAVDGTSSGILHCDDHKALDQWVQFIQTHIANLNAKSIKMSNRYLHPTEHITYIGWVSERMSEDYFDDPKQHWEPRFLILKASDICLFETPPLNADDLNKCVSLYKIYDTAMKMIASDKKGLDKRENCFYIETAIKDVQHYLSMETRHQLDTFETAYNRAVHDAVHNLQARTFACSFDNRPSGLVFDIKQGISLYDILTKRYPWQYRFQDLDSSSDDGKMRVQLKFRSPNNNNVEIKDIETDEVYPLVFTMHAFFLAKILASDPDFLKTIPLV